MVASRGLTTSANDLKAKRPRHTFTASAGEDFGWQPTGRTQPP